MIIKATSCSLFTTSTAPSFSFVDWTKTLVPLLSFHPLIVNHALRFLKPSFADVLALTSIRALIMFIWYHILSSNNVDFENTRDTMWFHRSILFHQAEMMLTPRQPLLPHWVSLKAARSINWHQTSLSLFLISYRFVRYDLHCAWIIVWMLFIWYQYQYQ